MKAGLILAAAIPALAGPVQFGLKAGIPLSDVISPVGDIGGRPFVSKVTRFTAGPVLQVRFPAGLRGELGAMFKRFQQTAGEVETRVGPGTPLEQVSRPYSKSGVSFELPMVAQYYFNGVVAKPYIEGGVVYNRLTSVLRPFRTLAQVSGVVQPAAQPHNRIGLVFGGGVEVGAGRFKIAPGIRVTKYEQRVPFLSGNVAADVLVGFYF